MCFAGTDIPSLSFTPQLLLVSSFNSFRFSVRYLKEERGRTKKIKCRKPSFSWGISVGINLESVVVNHSLEQTAVVCPE